VRDAENGGSRVTAHSRGEPVYHRENLPSHGGAYRADIPVALIALLADMFALYLKTKKFHWHVSGPHFRDYDLLLNDQAAQIFGTTDSIAERVHELGSPTIKSFGRLGRNRHIGDDDADAVAPRDMLAELLGDNRLVAREMQKTHQLCDESGDVVSAGLIEAWIDEAKGRASVLFETVQPGWRSGCRARPRRALLSRAGERR
jgi:starvation-inducible DNA-binding protein